MTRLAALLFTAVFALASLPVIATQLSVTDGQIRVPMPGRTVTAGYFTLHNNSAVAVKLIFAESAAFERAELHQHSHQNGVMRMEHVSYIDIAPNSSLSLQPGGLHLMLFDPLKSLVAGENVPVILHFNNGEQLTLSLPLTEMPRR
ncbi:copper chaperone PCu(A)C [Arsukibacterium sp.]|uniref:copper chaperone PCu(A)C n=1 Tax=Arsukibacterium sp. TaxID=1977258 RepID=UPI00299E1170|nr:copper chaperone PCu(A)C [Arsukibacterium sp.]MDX1677779.1 copper chaperone PCu(A)C [Arsukibacterium sp.]